MWKQAGVVILTPDKAHKYHFILLIGKTHREDMTIVNIHALL
jgi:hypothetical protein